MAIADLMDRLKQEGERHSIANEERLVTKVSIAMNYFSIQFLVLNPQTEMLINLSIPSGGVSRALD